MNTDSIRVTISTPRNFIEELKTFVSAGNISRFLVDAGKEKMERERRVWALKELRKLPPAFPDIENAAMYIHDMRRKDDANRNKKLGL